MNSPTLLGFVGQVTGSSISVKQIDSIRSGLAVINGRTYKTGQVGTFIRIPQGYLDLFGIISQVGANAIPESQREAGKLGERWFTVQLVGESIGNAFEKGISQYPTIDDEVHIVTESDLKRIYGFTGSGQVKIGHLSSSESIEVRLDLDKLVTRHSAILGSTGSGKSTTVTSILRAITNSDEYPNARILLLDIHGEYAKALSDLGKVFRINSNSGEEELFIPYWALDFEELSDFLFGGIAEEKASFMRDKIVELKKELLLKKPILGANETSLTVDMPIPFSLKKLWFDLIDQEVRTLTGVNRDIPAKIKGKDGDPETLTPPQYEPWRSGGQGAAVVINPAAPGIRKQLDHLRSRLFDHRFDFILHPGPWEPKLTGEVEKDLDSLLQGWLGHEKSITILDLSGVPSSVMNRLVGTLLRIIYDALFWSRSKSEGGTNRPLLIVMEEAHLYLSKNKNNLSEGTQSTASKLASRIVKEGRKYGIGACVVSQRPSEVDETILSQCGTFIALRLSNQIDRNHVQGTVPENLNGLMEMLPILRTGEAIITGEAARLPMRVRMILPPEKHRPDSEDPKVSKRWQAKRLKEDYEQVVAAWRAQSPREVKNKNITRRPVEDDSEEQE